MENKQITLDDILHGNVELYVNQEDINVIKTAFGNNPRLLKVLQKIFLPSVRDPEMPPESVNNDMWMSGVDWAIMPVDQVKPLILGRQLAIRYIMGGLIQLKAIINERTETATERALREKRNSNK